MGQRDDRGVDLDEAADGGRERRRLRADERPGGQEQQNYSRAHGPGYYSRCMCRNIKPLFNFAPPVTEDEIRASSLQFVRKISGFTKPSKANEAAFNQAIEDVSAAARTLLGSLVTTAPARDREIEAAKAKARAAERYGT